MAGVVDDDEVIELPCGGGGRDEPGAYAAELKRKLDLYCAAVAKSMEAKSQESSLPNSQASGTSQLISQASFDGGTSQWISQASFDGDGDEASLFTSSTAIGHADFRGKPANSSVSKEQSDGGGSRLEEKTDPANAKKMRRMLLNRESARRSRNRRQTHMCDLESQVSRLTSENASLLKRLADMTQKYKDATLHNRKLIVDAETMRTKVNIAEEAVRRLTETAVLLSSTSKMPPNIMTLTSSASDAASSAVSIEGSIKYFLQAPLQDDQTKPSFGFPFGFPNAANPFN